MQTLSEPLLFEPFILGGGPSTSGQQSMIGPELAQSQALFARALTLIDDQPHEALQLLDRAATLAPSVAAIQSAAHSALVRLGRTQEALLRIEAAIRLDPDNGEHHYNRAIMLVRAGRPADAEASYRQAITHDPDNLDAFINLGNILANARRFSDALACFDHVITRRPADIDARNNRLNLLVAAGEVEQACEGFSHLVRDYPGRPTIMLNFANALRAAGRSEDSAQWVSLGRSLDPTGQTTRLHAAKLLLAQGFVFDALAALRALANELPQDESVIASLALALRTCAPQSSETHEAFLRLQSLPSAVERWRTAIGQWKLLNGNFSEGWLDYEARWNAPDGPRLRRDYAVPQWTGKQDLTGKTILVHFEQGAGDTLQFSRYLRLIRARGARVVLEVPHALESIMVDSGLAEQVITGHAQPTPAIDFHCPMMSLPLAFNTVLDSVPSHTPYLVADQARSEQWQRRLGERRAPRIGLVWNGRRENTRDAGRSIGFMQFMRALPLGPDYLCLQPEIRREDAFLMNARPDIRHFADGLTDYAETAALIDQLDLVISVDTSVAHLAGALNRPVWILLPLDPDFRWLLGRSDSPWYPSARLFRQADYQDWTAVLAQVRKGIESLMDGSEVA